MKKSRIPLLSASPVLLVVGAMLLGIVPLFRVNAMGMLYSDEIYTSRSVGGGWEVDDSVYFLINYGLYRKPQGIARFPDGGVSRYITREVFLCRVDQHYRRAIIESIADGTIRADPEDILRRMEEKQLSLDEPYRSLYQMRAAEVIRPLEALNE